MNKQSEIIIPLSKTKNIFLVLGSIMFVIGAVFMLKTDPVTIEHFKKLNSPTLFYGIASLGIVLFGYTCIFGLKMLFDSSPGLIINSKGIFDNSSGVAAGFIPWDEITDIKEYEIKGVKFISILVSNPEKYLNKGNFVIKIANKANMKRCGTPINISTNILKMNYQKLFSILKDYYLDQKQNKV